MVSNQSGIIFILKNNSLKKKELKYSNIYTERRITLRCRNFCWAKLANDFNSLKFLLNFVFINFILPKIPLFVSVLKSLANITRSYILSLYHRVDQEKKNYRMKRMLVMIIQQEICKSLFSHIVIFNLY